MAGPVKSDSFQISPLDPGSRVIDDDGSGNIRFTDQSGTFILSDLISISDSDGIYKVGSGSGSEYLTISDAISSAVSGSTILILPGVYTENIVIDKDIILIGLGNVEIEPIGDSDTITITDGVGTSPEYVKIYGVLVSNSNNGKACVKISGISGTNIGSNFIIIDSCDISPSNVSTYAVYGNILNNIYIRNAKISGPATSSIRIDQASSVSISNSNTTSVRISYDDSGVKPSGSVSEYTIKGCNISGDILCNILGDSSVLISDCVQLSGDVTSIGDRDTLLLNDSVGDVIVSGSNVYVKSSKRGSVSGSGLYSEDFIYDSIEFIGVDTVSYSFDIEAPDTNYIVIHDEKDGYIESKTSSGFDFKFPAPETKTVFFSVVRRI